MPVQGFNPSICGAEVLIRTANYTQGRPFAPDWTPDSQNWLLTPRTGVVRAINDDHGRRLVIRNGLEDGRLFRWPDGRLGALFSGLYQANVAPGRAIQRNTMTLMADLDAPTEIRLLHSGEKREKNWMPIVVEERLYALYSPSVFRVLDLTEETPSVVREAPGFASDKSDAPWRGGSQLVPYQDGYLGVVHRATGEGAERDYEHAFIFLDGSFGPAELSPPFRFFGHGVEFCAGLDVTGDTLTLSFGRSDRTGYLWWTTIQP